MELGEVRRYWDSACIGTRRFFAFPDGQQLTVRTKDLPSLLKLQMAGWGEDVTTVSENISFLSFGET